MMANFFWGAGGSRLTPEEVAAQRKYGQSLLSQGVDYSPIHSPWQGAARVAQALMGGWETGQADYAAKQNASESNAVIQALLGGSGAPAAAPVATAPVASSSTASPLGATAIPAGRDEFVNTIMPMAQEASAKTGLDPRLIVAQAALESGWGKSAPGNNLFGIKSHGMPGGNTMATTEVVNGQPVTVQDSFRAYASPADSVKGYADFMTQNPRYEPVRAAQGLEAQVAALGKSGYATDPAYAQKVMQIAQGLPAPTAAPTPTARPAINPAIVQAISSPYMSDSAKKIGTMLFQNQLEQQQKAADPLRQAQLAKLQQELTPLAAPTVDAQGNLIQTDPLGKVNVLRPAEARPTSVSEYEYYKKNLPPGQQSMPYDTWATAKARAGAMNVTNNVGGGSDKQIFDTFSENAKEARAAANGLVALRSARQALQGPGGAITGFGADEKLTFQKLGAALGVADPASVQNTETFRAAIAPQVASMLKSTVGSANISNSDREFAEKAAGGSIKLDGGSINRLLDIMEKAGTARLELHQQQLDAVYPDANTNKRERALFGVQMPAVPPQPEKPQQQPVINGAIAVNPKTGERRMLQNGKWGARPMSELPAGFVLEGQPPVSENELPAGFVMEGAKPSQAPYSGTILPMSRDAQGNVAFDSNAGLFGLVRKAISGAGSALALPGDVATGRTSIVGDDGRTSPEVINRATELAALTSPINPGIRAGDRVIPGQAMAMARQKPAVPTTQELAAAGTANYNAARESGLEITGDAVANWSRQQQAQLFEKRYSSVDAPATYAKLKELEGAAPGSFGNSFEPPIPPGISPSYSPELQPGRS